MFLGTAPTLSKTRFIACVWRLARRIHLRNAVSLASTVGVNVREIKHKREANRTNRGLAAVPKLLIHLVTKPRQSTAIRCVVGGVPSLRENERPSEGTPLHRLHFNLNRSKPPMVWRSGANAGTRTRINGFGGHHTIHCATFAGTPLMKSAPAAASSTCPTFAQRARAGFVRVKRCTKK